MEERLCFAVVFLQYTKHLICEILPALISTMYMYELSSNNIYMYHNKVGYSHKKRPMGGAPYIGPRLGDGPIFEVPVSC